MSLSDWSVHSAACVRTAATTSAAHSRKCRLCKLRAYVCSCTYTHRGVVTCVDVQPASMVMAEVVGWVEGKGGGSNHPHSHPCPLASMGGNFKGHSRELESRSAKCRGHNRRRSHGESQGNLTQSLPDQVIINEKKPAVREINNPRF